MKILKEWVLFKTCSKERTIEREKVIFLIQYKDKEKKNTTTKKTVNKIKLKRTLFVVVVVVNQITHQQLLHNQQQKIRLTYRSHESIYKC